MAGQSTLRHPNLPTKEPTNPKHEAPIPLYPLPTVEGADESEVKLKLKRNPGNTNSPTYEKAFKPWDGNTAEDYCRFMVMFEEITKQVPLSTAPAKFSQMVTLLAGTSKVNWETAVANLPEDINNTDEGFETALYEFALNYAVASARQKQRRFINRNCRKPMDMQLNIYWNRIQELNRYMEYLPGTGAKFEEDQMREILFASLPGYVEEFLNATNFDWESQTHSNREVITKIQNAITYHEKWHGKSNGKSKDKSKGKSADKSPAKKGTKGKDTERWKKVCNWCTKNKNKAKGIDKPFRGHTDEECRSKPKNGKDEVNMMSTEDEIEHILSDKIFHSAQKDVSLLYAIMNAKTRKPKVTNQSSIMNLTTTVRARLKQNDSDSSNNGLVETINVLIDTGCSKTIIKRKVLSDETLTNHRVAKETIWNTKGGVFTTRSECDTTFTLPNFTSSREIQHRCAVDEANLGPYDMIIGRDLLKKLGMDILFSTGHLRWDGITIPMQPCDSNAIASQESEAVLQQLEEMENEELMEATKVLDAKYEKADIDKEVASMTHLSKDQQNQLRTLLYKYEKLFDGTLGEWDTEPIELELQENAKPFHAKPMPVPHIHLATLKTEIKRLCEIGVMRKVTGPTDWAAPSFIVPKKNNQVRIVTDLRVLNSQLKRRTWPMPKVQDLLRDLAGFTYATSIDLNMGYWTLRLSPGSSKLCTVIFPWGKYEYLRLPMGATPSAFIFQQKMDTLMDGLDDVLAYIDDVLVINKGSFEEHLQRVELVLRRLLKANLTVNLPKSFFALTEIEYLGYLVTRNGIRPIANKVEAIQRLKPPKTLKQLRSFLGMVNYYRDMWKSRSHMLAPLTELTRGKKGDKRKPIQWTKELNDCFENIKKHISEETILAFPDYEKPFDIHVDASDYQLGGVISQDGRPIAFYSRKLNPAQRNYTTGEREMLSIVETLREFRNMLLGYNITVYTDHKNNIDMQTMFKSPRIQRWRWIIEEFNPIIKYINGPRNEVADCLSRLDADFTTYYNEFDEVQLAERFDMNIKDDETKEIIYPLSTGTIAEYQRKDKTLLSHLKNHPEYFTKAIDGTEVILFHKKIYIPKPLRKQVVQWYHNMLQHPGIARTERTIRQHLTWPGLSEDVASFVKRCHKCQLCKNPRKKYGHLPAKEFTDNPWDTLCVDMIGPYSITTKDDKELTLHAMTMCDPATGWFEITEVDNKKARTTATVLDQTWFSRYPRPKRCIFDNGNEFLGSEFQDMLESYGVKPDPTTVKNPQANYVERVHQTLGNMIRTHEVDKMDFDYKDPWSQILSNCAWAIRTTAHTIMEATPAQLVFGRDMLFDLSFKTKWKSIKEKRQTAIEHNNERENSKRTKYEYKVGDKVLLERGESVQRKLIPKRTGPYSIVRIYDNGTLKIRKGNYVQRVSIRRCVPYLE